MTKRRITRKSNRPFTYNPHYYSWGGDLLKSLGGKDTFSLKNTFSGANVGKILKGGLSSVAGNLIGGGANKLLSNGLESGAGSAINSVGSTVGSAVGMVNPVMGAAISAASGLISGATNALFGSKLNEEKIREVQDSNSAMNKTTVDSSSADSIEAQWGTQDFGSNFSQSDIGEDGLFSSKAKDKYNELKLQQNIARNRALTAYSDAAHSVDTEQDLQALANFSAYGGPIHIASSKKGTFTAAATKHNMGVQEFASKVLANKEDYSPAMVKKANFAKNASKWHSFGGYLNTNGADFSNGQKFIGNGGTHESNPYEGVNMGIDSEGTPNLVEQGEVIFNDYVFSNRMFADGGLLSDFNLPTSYKDHSFAAIAEKLGEESKERPNDPISKRGLMDSMVKLQQAQETVRENMNNKKNNKARTYAHGGKLGKLFDGIGNMPNYLDGVDYSDWQDYGTLLEPINGEKEMKKALANTNPTYDNNNSSGLTWLRYAPVVGAAIGIGQGLFSNPDYSSADAILSAAKDAGNYTPVTYNPLGNYLQYKPMDRNYYTNKLSAQASATRNALRNSISPSTNAALLAADYNSQLSLGNLAKQAEEYNLAQRQAVETFNRATNQANSEMGLKAAMANQSAQIQSRNSRLNGVIQAMKVRDDVDARRAASMSANFTNFFNSLGDIGKENYSRNMIMSNPALYYSIDSKGNVTYKNGYENLSEAEKAEVRDAANKSNKKKKAKGGYLTI